MSCYCKCPVAFPHGAWVGQPFMIVVFPDHTHFLSINQLILNDCSNSITYHFVGTVN